MELVAIVFMLGAGGAIAAFAMVAMRIAGHESESQARLPERRDAIAASILVHVVQVGGTSLEEATRRVRRGSGIAAPVTGGIDVASWADSYAREATPEQRRELLEMAVRLVAAEGTAVPLRQYAALLDLSFGLGFQTDALARLRQTYGFDYVDHAKDGRPAEGLSAPLFARSAADRERLLASLELSGEPTRRELTAAYRKLVARHHPDRFHGAAAGERDRAADHFIAITRAYEALLPSSRD